MAIPGAGGEGGHRESLGDDGPAVRGGRRVDCPHPGTAEDSAEQLKEFMFPFPENGDLFFRLFFTYITWYINRIINELIYTKDVT